MSLLLRQERDKDMVSEEKRLREVKKEVETEDSKLKKVFFPRIILSNVSIDF